MIIETTRTKTTKSDGSIEEKSTTTTRAQRGEVHLEKTGNRYSIWLEKEYGSSYISLNEEEVAQLKVLFKLL